MVWKIDGEEQNNKTKPKSIRVSRMMAHPWKYTGLEPDLNFSYMFFGISDFSSFLGVFIQINNGSRWDCVIVQLASIVSQFLSQGIYGCVVWLEGYPVVNYEDIGVIQLYKMCLLLVNSYCTPLLLHIQPFYNTLFLCFVGYACTTVHHTLVPLSVSLPVVSPSACGLTLLICLYL